MAEEERDGRNTSEEGSKEQDRLKTKRKKERKKAEKANKRQRKNQPNLAIFGTLPAVSALVAVAFAYWHHCHSFSSVLQLPLLLAVVAVFSVCFCLLLLHTTESVAGTVSGRPDVKVRDLRRGPLVFPR